MKSKLTVRQKPMKNRSRLFLIYTAAFLLCLPVFMPALL